jgi:hypothetical protein
MEITLNTPALLFPAVSLILLAFTNRFNHLAQLIRSLHAKWQVSQDTAIQIQLNNLRLRTRLIRDMQALGVLCMFLNVLCMFLIYTGHPKGTAYVFGASLITLLLSLALSVWEVWISTNALQLELRDMDRLSPVSTTFWGLGPRRKARHHRIPKQVTDIPPSSTPHTS